MQTQVMARVQAVLVPAIPVDGQVPFRGQKPVDDGAVRPVVRDEEQLVPRTGRVGIEPLRIGGLVERIDRHRRTPRHDCGECVRRDKGVVIGGIERPGRQIRVADLPQDVDLRRPVVRLLIAEHVDGRILPGGGRGTPIAHESDARRITGPFEVTLEGPGEVVVAPDVGVLPVGGTDPDGDPSRCHPGEQQVAQERSAVGAVEVGHLDPLGGRRGDALPVRVGPRDDDVELVEVRRTRLRDHCDSDEARRRLADVGFGIGHDDDIDVWPRGRGSIAPFGWTDDLPIDARSLGRQPWLTDHGHPERFDRPVMNPSDRVTQDLAPKPWTEMVEKGRAIALRDPQRAKVPLLRLGRRGERLVDPEPGRSAAIDRQSTTFCAQARREFGVEVGDRCRAGVRSGVALWEARRPLECGPPNEDAGEGEGGHDPGRRRRWIEMRAEGRMSRHDLAIRAPEVDPGRRDRPIRRPLAGSHRATTNRSEEHRPYRRGTRVDRLDEVPEPIVEQRIDLVVEEADQLAPGRVDGGTDRDRVIRIRRDLDVSSRDRARHRRLPLARRGRR